MQSDWYHVVRQKYGLPLDSRHLYTKTDWEFFAAAVMEENVRSEILESVAKWVNETNTGKQLGLNLPTPNPTVEKALLTVTQTDPSQICTRLRGTVASPDLTSSLDLWWVATSLS